MSLILVYAYSFSLSFHSSDRRIFSSNLQSWSSLSTSLKQHCSQANILQPVISLQNLPLSKHINLWLSYMFTGHDHINAMFFSTLIHVIKCIHSFLSLYFHIAPTDIFFTNKKSSLKNALFSENGKIPISFLWKHSEYVKTKNCHENILSFFCKGALFRGKGGPPVLEKPARHLPRQGRGFVRPPLQYFILKKHLDITTKLLHKHSEQKIGYFYYYLTVTCTYVSVTIKLP